MPNTPEKRRIIDTSNGAEERTAFYQLLERSKGAIPDELIDALWNEHYRCPQKGSKTMTKMYAEDYLYGNNEPSVVMAFVDIDHFGTVNKKNSWSSHALGDRCLKEFGNMLGSYCAATGFICIAFGGEEFLLVKKIPNGTVTDLRDAATSIYGSLSRFREEMSNTVFRTHEPGVGIKLTFSAGIAALQGPYKETTKENPSLFLLAKDISDKAQQEAKAAGRDRIFLSVDQASALSYKYAMELNKIENKRSITNGVQQEKISRAMLV